MDLYNFVRLSHIFTLRSLVLLFISSFSVPIAAFSFVELTKKCCHLEYNLFPKEIDLFVQLIIWGCTFIIIKSMCHWHKYIVPFYKGIRNKWDQYDIVFGENEDRFKKEWEFQGDPIFTREGIVATNTNSGLLLKPKLLWTGWIWENFEATINIDFYKQARPIFRELYENNKNEIKERDTTAVRYKRLLGIIFRARDLENYFLLEVWRIDKFIVIRPHVRIDGNWDAPFLNPDANSYPVNQEQTKFKLTLKVENDRIALVINDDKKKPLIWILPTHYEINLPQYSKPKQEDLARANVKKIPFRLKGGRFGFRNYGDEAAIVKSLDVKPIKNKVDNVFKYFLKLNNFY